MPVHWRRIACALCALAGVSLPRTVQAAASLLTDTRQLEVDVGVGDLFQDVDPLEATDGPDFAGADYNKSISYNNVHTSSGAATASATASQISSLLGGTLFTSISAMGQATTSGQTDSDAIYAIGYALSEFDIDFRLLTPHAFTMSGVLDEVGSGSLAELALSEIGGSTIVTIGDEGAFAEPGNLLPAGYTLPAGDYRLRIRARVNANIGDSNVFNRSASFQNVQFTLIPEPASGLLIALGAAALARPRRARRV